VPVRVVIRNQQMEVFLREAVVDSLLRAHRAEAEGVGIEPYCERIEAALARAAEQGFEAPADQGRFAELCLRDEGFEASSWAQAILRWRRSPEEKLAALEARAQRNALRGS